MTKSQRPDLASAASGVTPPSFCAPTRRPAHAVFVGVALWLVASSTASAAQDAATEAWAVLLTDHPALGVGDRDAAVDAWFDALEAEPDHPLAAATALLLDAVDGELADPGAFRARAARLQPQRFTPAAQGPLARLRGNALAARPEAGADGVDLHPDVLAAHFVLGPLGPAQDPLALAIDPALLADPGLAAEHAGLDGLLRWVPLRRNPCESRVDPAEVLESDAGWLLLAAPFTVEGGGPAWIEVDLRSPRDGAESSTDAVFGFGSSFRGWVLGGQPMSTPGYALGLAGGSQATLRLDAGGHGALQRHACVLRDGRNVLLLRLPVNSGLAPRLRVLGVDGRPFPGCRSAERDGSPGRPVPGAAPTAEPDDALSPLLRAASLSPHAEALLGLLLALDLRPSEGLEHLDRAVERDGGAGLTALLAGVVERMAYLPTSWSHTRARSLVERALELDPEHIAMGVARAAMLVGEDKQEQAIEELEALTESHTGQVATLLELSRAYASLGLEVPAWHALREAAERAPHSPEVLRQRIAFAREQGRRGESLALQAELVDALGRGAGRVEGLARSLIAAGRLEDGLATWAEALARDPSRGRRERWTGELMSLERHADARRELEALAEEHPGWPAVWLGLAEVSLRTGDRAAEETALRRVLALRPGHRAVRERLAAITGDDDTRAFIARYALDGEALIADYQDAGRDDSVVRLLDEGLVQLFPDGSMETRTHEVVQLRDLAACEERGTLRLRGDVLRVESVKPDGRRFEPVLVGGEYVMPNLEPGDLLDTITRTFDTPPADGVLRPGAWFFASIDEPFLVSRYVVRVPPGLDLRLEQRRFDGSHEQQPWGADLVHVFEARDVPRVLPERGMPPPDWFLPWVEFGQDDDPLAALHRAQVAWRSAAQPTHELRAAAAEALVDVGPGQEARARALHTFVEARLDQRAAYPVPAVVGLLARDGNPTLLFAALLETQGIAHELVLSRGVSPAADAEPDPPFVEGSRLQRRLLLRVMPDDGEPVWCDLSRRGLPYGWLKGDAPGAEAVGLDTGEPLREPWQQPSGSRLDLLCRLAADGSATVQGSVMLLGAMGQVAKEQLRQVPEDYHRGIVQGSAAALLPGIDLSEHSIDGLVVGDERQLTLRFAGRVPHFLDPDLSRALPIVPLGVSAGLAVEGRRRLPYLSADQGIEHTQVRLVLPPELAPAELPAGFEGAAKGWTYRLAIERPASGSESESEPADHELTVTRVLEREPFHVTADAFGELVEFAAALDASERARLRLARVEAVGDAGSR